MPRIVAALAAGRDYLDVFDYALVDQNVLSELQIAMLLSEGSSLDEYANTQWHRDLIEPSEAQRKDLAQAIQEEGTIQRIPLKEVQYLISQAIAAKHIAWEKLPEGIQKKIPKPSS